MTNFFKILLLSIFIMPLGTIVPIARTAIAQESPFVSIENHKRMISKDSLALLESSQYKAALSTSGKALIFSDAESHLVVRTGPEDDMLSFRIQELRNPKLIVRAGSVLHILFVNADSDMWHDIKLGAGKPPFPLALTLTGTIGTSKLPHEESGTFSAEEIVIRAVQPGEYSYFCDVHGHAKGGMWGKIIIVSKDMPLDEMKRLDKDTIRNSKDHGMNMDNSSMEGMDMSDGMEKMNGLLLTEQMSQEGSGTSWLPSSSPMYMLMMNAGHWMLMLHGDIFPRYNYQGGPRGGTKFDAPNMIMGMLEHGVGSDGQFTAHLMMSLDPVTIGPKGYPLLLQTGESYQGAKLVDIQHPHDLFDEVSAAYSERFSEKSSAFIYLGYPGEPALGPPVFMHRPSAMSNPNAPLSHHWIDATHVTFGVVTAGYLMDGWKLEASLFNGTEPDENRFDFDPLKLNSYSGRLSFNPSNDWAFQISSGLIKNPESDGVDVIRSTASAIYTKKFENKDWWATTAVWGQNHEVNLLNFDALLIESQYAWKSWTAFGRAEYVQKTNSELNLTDDPEKINDVEEITLGVTRTLFQIISLDVELGVEGTYNFVPPSLESLYTAHPIGYEIYLSIHPSIM